MYPKTCSRHTMIEKKVTKASENAVPHADHTCQEEFLLEDEPLTSTNSFLLFTYFYN